jgi:hypothetical protein
MLPCAPYPSFLRHADAEAVDQPATGPSMTAVP